MDWNTIFALSQPVGETVLRGTLVYWFLVLVFRFVLRRDAGSVGVADLIMLVIIADAMQNAMAGEYKSVTDGLILGSTLVFWNVALDYVTFRFPVLDRIVSSPRLHLVRDGQPLRKNLRREFITIDELLSKVHEEGIGDLQGVKDAYLEPDGNISIIPRS